MLSHVVNTRGSSGQERARHYPPGVRLALLPFGEQALRHFLYLERKSGRHFRAAPGGSLRPFDPW